MKPITPLSRALSNAALRSTNSQQQLPAPGRRTRSRNVNIRLPILHESHHTLRERHRTYVPQAPQTATVPLTLHGGRHTCAAHTELHRTRSSPSVTDRSNYLLAPDGSATIAAGAFNRTAADRQGHPYRRNHVQQVPHTLTLPLASTGRRLDLLAAAVFCLAVQMTKGSALPLIDGQQGEGQNLTFLRTSEESFNFSH